MLDLSVFTEEYFDITMPTGEVINLKKPTQALVLNLIGFKTEMEKSHKKNDVTRELELYTDLLSSILNNNKENKHYDNDYIDKHFNLAMGQVLINGYTEFMNGVQSNPNS